MDPEYASEDSLLVGSVARGSSLRIPFRVPGQDSFTVVLFLAGGPEHGRFRVRLGGAGLGGAEPYSAELDGAGRGGVGLDGAELGVVDARRDAFVPWFPAELGPVRIEGGEHVLSLEPMAPEGQPVSGAAPERSAVGLVALQLRPRSRFIDAWSTVGSWPCPKEGGWETAHPPEERPEPGATYRLPDGSEVGWKPFEGDRVWLGGGDWRVAYGLTYVWSPDDRTVGCFIGKDDGLKLWVGDDVVFDQFTWSHSTPDQFHATARLKKGWNRVLVKCANWFGSWGFAVRIGAPDGELRFARAP